MLNEVEELRVCNIKNCFITRLFEMATETGSRKNITFHLFRNILCVLCSQAVPMDMFSVGFTLVLKHLTVIRSLLMSIT